MKRLGFGIVSLCLIAGAPAFAAADCAAGDGLARSAISGSISHPANFVHRFGEGYRFELMPVETGWDIGVFDADGAAINVFAPASGIAQANRRALLGRDFAHMPPDGVSGQHTDTRRFAFGSDARNPDLHPELNIVPGAAGGASAPRFGAGELEVWGFRLDREGGEPKLTELEFRGCLEWTPVAAGEINAEGGPPPETDFPGFDPDEQILQEAAMQFHAIADQLNLVNNAEIDADTALERIAVLRESLRETRRIWRETDREERIAARMTRLADIERAERAMIAAVAAYGENPNIDWRVLHLLQDPPIIGDFLREPAVETFQGIYRQGFEASDFYLFDGEGPWWLEATREAWEELQTYMVQRPGRGSSVTVALTLTGWRESEGGYGAFGNYETRIYVESIDSVRPITQDEFWTAVGARQ